MKSKAMFTAATILCAAALSVLTGRADAAGWRRTYYGNGQVQAVTAPGPTGLRNGFNAGNSSSGWNRSNSWYNIPQYGNFAPPPYATSRNAFIQVGPLPAFGGVRSLPGWGGAR